jgi:hypothetical protein
MELLGTGSIDWRTRGYKPSLGSSRGDTLESIFVELPDRCSRSRRLAAQWVSLMVGSLLPVSPSLTVADRPECRGFSTVIFGTCSACFAEFFQDDDYLQPWRDQAPSPEPPTLAYGTSVDSRRG